MAHKFCVKRVPLNKLQGLYYQHCQFSAYPTAAVSITDIYGKSQNLCHFDPDMVLKLGYSGISVTKITTIMVHQVRLSPASTAV